ncbi:hypothetical protein ACN20G_25655 [Streptomyces sp. BI20]|uniref:hypothetical protein n=1 Tax=Streptomyces sp. BI20 TaxID=3403460 RepID=UPI003C748152
MREQQPGHGAPEDAEHRIVVEAEAPTTEFAGFTVTCVDGPVGTVDGHAHEVAGSWLVVDIGTRLTGRVVLVPREAVVEVDEVAREIRLDLDRERVRAAEEYVRDERGPTEADHRDELALIQRPGPFSAPPG